MSMEKKKTCQFELEKERDVADRPPRALAESASCLGGRRNTIFLLPRKNSSAPEMQQKEKKFPYVGFSSEVPSPSSPSLKDQNTLLRQHKKALP